MNGEPLSSRGLLSTCGVLERPFEGLSKPGPQLEAARRRYRWCQRWTESLTGLRRQFDGDLDQYLLLLVFEQAEMARALAGLKASARTDRPQHPEPRGMNAMSVAEICGIPRETARRKLKRLIMRQAISLGADGLYYLASKSTDFPPQAALSAFNDLADGVLPPPLVAEGWLPGR